MEDESQEQEVVLESQHGMVLESQHESTDKAQLATVLETQPESTDKNDSHSVHPELTDRQPDDSLEF